MNRPEYRQIGIFSVPSDFINEMRDNIVVREELGRAIFGKMLIVRAEWMYSQDAIEYTGISVLFEPVPYSCHPLKYDCIITRHTPKERPEWFEVEFKKL